MNDLMIEAVEPELDDASLEVSEAVIDDSVIPLAHFIEEFGAGLLQSVSEQLPPIFNGDPNPNWERVMQGLMRKPFPEQQTRVQAVCQLLLNQGEKAAIINGEMGCGKTMLGIAAASVMASEGYRRTLVIAPPHLVYKWRREILETVANAKVWVLNGPDTLRQLLKIRETSRLAPESPEFYILGRVRMRMGFDWQHAVIPRKIHQRVILPETESHPLKRSFVTHIKAACPDCGTLVLDEEGEVMDFAVFQHLVNQRGQCRQCQNPLWSLKRPDKPKDFSAQVRQAICQIPSLGPKTADRLLNDFGTETLAGMLADNLMEFVNLMDENGDLVFSDRQAKRMERALANQEVGFGQGGYQASEFIKRYLPDGFIDFLVIDEAHEYKNQGTAQGQAMGVLAQKAKKTVLLTGTLMGGFASDLFFLLWRILPERMMEDGFAYNSQRSLGAASMAFMRQHGVLKDVYKETDDGNHRTARGKRMTVHTSKAPGFGPKGVLRYVLPYTVFLKLKDIEGNVLPPYEEILTEVPMSPEQAEAYSGLSGHLKQEMKQALARGDKTLLGVVLNVLLAWPDTCFRAEEVVHPRKRNILAFVPSLFSEDDISPKEQALIDLCRKQKALNRRVLVYTIYTGKRDTASRLKRLLDQAGFKSSVLRSSVSTEKREDWIADQVERGIDVLICNPELVKTGLDLLDFPTICFTQTGYNVYTVQQAARRSWRIGQQHPIEVHFLGYSDTAQTACLSLMAKKIAVSQSTSGDVPDTGLEVLNSDGDSIDVALAKQLMM